MHVQSKSAIDLAEARLVVAEHGWARIVTVGAEGLRATYGFFLLEDSDDDDAVVVGHFARADPQCADIEARTPALLIFEGPGFVSASWYRPEMTDVPSTMNHISVHLQGTPSRSTATSASTPDATSSATRRRSATPAAPRGRRADALAAVAPDTVAFRLRATRVEAKAKLSQAMPRPVREAHHRAPGRARPHHHPALAAR